MKNNLVKILVDFDDTLFTDRVDEITSGTSYEAVRSCVSKLKDALYQNPDIPALAAPQIGENLRLFVVRTARDADGSNRFKVFLNPFLVAYEGLHLSRETCASYPNKQFVIPRKDKVHVAYQEEAGQINSESFIGAFGEVVQQMIELLDGIRVCDYGLDLDDVGGIKAFDRASKKDKQQVIQLYLASLQEAAKDADAEINNDQQLLDIKKSIDLMTGIATGDIILTDKDNQIVDPLKPMDHSNNEFEDNLTENLQEDSAANPSAEVMN